VTLAGAIHTITGSRWRYAMALAVTALVLAVFILLLLPYLQTWRANSLLADANSHIESANLNLSRINTDLLEIEGFTSLESIELASEALAEAQPLLMSSNDEIGRARRKADAAANLFRLPVDYQLYLKKKSRITDLRSQQQDILLEAAGKLDDLYAVAPLVFQSMEDMDRLFGQFQQALGDIRETPQQAAAQLGQLSDSMHSIQHELDSGYQRSSFEMLKDFSANAGQYAALATAAAELAGAIATGEQEQTQEAANNLESQLLSTTVGIDYLDLWLRQEIDPLRDRYRQLQSEQEQLDGEAKEAYPGLGA
jgi:hypothetical protein